MNIKKALLITVVIFIALSISCTQDSKTLGLTTRYADNLFISSAFNFPDEFVLSRENETDYVVSYHDDKLYILGYNIVDIETFTTEPAVFIYDFATDTEVSETLIPCHENAAIDFLKFDSKSNRITIETVDYITTINKMSVEGDILFSVELDKILNAANISAVKKLDIYQDEIYIANSDAIVVLSENCEKLYQIDIENKGYKNFIISENGDIILKYADKSGNKINYRYIDKNKKSLGDNLNIMTGANYITGTEIYGGSGYNFYYKTNTALYGYNVTDNELVTVLDWAVSDLNPASIFSIVIISPDVIIYFGYDSIDQKENFAVLKRVSEDMVIERYTIELAHIGDMTNALNQAVINFNQSNPKYRIEVKNFSNEDKGYGYVDDFNLAISTGYIPDLILLNPYMPVQNYIQKGLLTNMYEFIDNDPDIERDDFFPFILNSYEVNDNLYQLNVLYTLLTFVGKTENVGQQTSWSFEDFKNLYDSLSDDQMLWSRLSPSALMAQLYLTGIYEFIDYDTYTCDFENEEFIKAIEIIKSFDDESVYNNMSGNDLNEFYMNESDMYKSDKLILCETRFYNMASFLITLMNFNFEDITFKGSPSVSGNNHMSYILPTSFAITAQSKVQEGSWEFIKTLLDNKFQTNPATTALSVTKSGFDGAYEKFMEYHYYADNMGNLSQEKIALTDEAQLAAGLHEVILSKDVLDKIIEILKSLKITCIEDAALTDIVGKELLIFLNTDMLASDAAKVIQSKVNLYLNEIKPF